MGQISASDHFLRPNPYISAGHPPPHDKMSSRPPPFARSTDQNSHLMQNLEPSHLATMQPQQVPSGGMKDFLGAGNSNQSANGWGHNLKGAAIGESWNQTHLPSVAGTPQHPGFSQQSLPLDTMPTIPSNAFNHHAQNNRASGTPSNNHPISDDSQFVDSMFDSLGVPGGDGDGLLNALNSGSLGGAIPQQGNWGSAIAGWGSLGEEADSSSFLQNSRLGGIAMNPPQQDNHPHNREKR